LRFDVNQTEFPDEFKKDIWQRGISVLPLELSLTGIDDLETREGLTQIYNFTMDLLWDMYNNSDKYTNIPRNNTERYIRSVMEKSKRNTNSQYPLLTKYMNEFFSLVWAMSPKTAAKNWNIIIQCDFRCFNKNKSQEIKYLLYTLSDENRICFKELHDYVIAKGAKKESNRYRYKYKNEHIVCFDLKPSVFISYKLKSGSSFESFIAEVNNQTDKELLLAYIQDETSICNHCGISTCKAYVEFFICTPRGRKRHHHFTAVDTNKIKMAGMELNRGCAYHLDDVTQSFTADEINIMKRLIDIRFVQIDNK